jgi:hypothetical protein
MLTPLLPDRWDPETAAHLALRAGFGQTPDESKKWSQQGLEVTLNHLLQTPPDNLTPPAWAYPTRDEDLPAESSHLLFAIFYLLFRTSFRRVRPPKREDPPNRRSPFSSSMV